MLQISRKQLTYALTLCLGTSLLAQNAQARSASGSYLAGRHAELNSDYEAAARYMQRALRYEPENLEFLNSALRNNLRAGKLLSALPLARQLHEQNPKDSFAVFLLVAGHIKSDNWQEVEALIADFEQRIAQDAAQGVEPDKTMLFMVEYVKAWKLAQTDLQAGIESLKSASIPAEFSHFAALNEAYMLLSQGAYKQAEYVLRAELEQPREMGKSSLYFLLGEFLENTGRSEEAIEFYIQWQEQEPNSETIKFLLSRAQAQTADTPNSNWRVSASRGIANVFFEAAGFLGFQDRHDEGLIYLQIAQWLEPELHDAQALSATILYSFGQTERSLGLFETIPKDSLTLRKIFHTYLDILQDSGRYEQALAIIEAVEKDGWDSAVLEHTRGDLMRYQGRYKEAELAYTQAIENNTNIEQFQYILYHFRGVCRERQNNWEGAVADLLYALELEPDSPQTLNYLAYGWVDRGVQLERALEMIKRAVDLRPNDGYIVDSLGWVYYKLGDYAQAVEYLERAVRLRVNDPVINDHLGDALWRAGRYYEAEFQWNRVKHLNPEDSLREQVIQKIDHGLNPLESSLKKQ